jgi:putative hemolysin
MELLVLLALIFVNGVFAMSEIAIVSSRQARLQQYAEAGSPGSRAALQLLDAPGPFLSTVQVGITTIGILVGAFGENAIAGRLAGVFADVPLVAPHAGVLATAVMVVLVTYLSVVLGELVPKRLALSAPERIAALAARPMQMLARIAHPLVLLLDSSSNLVLRVIGVRRAQETPVSEDEIRILIRQGTAQGVFHPHEQQMVDNVFGLDALRVTSLMTPRRDVLYIDLDDDEAVNRGKLVAGRFQTLPVCRGGLDGVVGVIDAKHLLAMMMERDGRIALCDATHAPLYVPESITAAQLLQTLQRRNSHAALVVDEYGKVEGLVTVTDLLGAIIGAVPGERHAGDDDLVRRADGSWLVDGMVLLDRVWHVTGIADPVGPSPDYRTLAGLVLHARGRVPATGDVIDLGGCRLEVVDMDGHRIDRVLVRPRPPESTE